MGRLGVVALVLAAFLTGCTSSGDQVDDREYGATVEACDLVVQTTAAILAEELTETPPSPSPEPTRTSTERVDMTVCRHAFGDPDHVPIAPYDERARDTPGTPLYRYTSVTAMRFHAADGQSGTELARHWLTSDPQPKVPDLATLGLDDGDITHRQNGVQSYTRIRAVDANLALIIEYGGANGNAKPPGMPAEASRRGALRLLTEAAARRPCTKSDC
ncbi:MAG: hypothetical protein HOY78_15055 [Saccharothrix sp.]|nr:hypothetical protein [Saccharothrix sp.]